MPQFTLSPRIPLSRRIRATVWSMTNGRCFYCGLHTNPFGGSFCIDHMTPLSRGGSNDLTNLAPCCKHCNADKATMNVQEFRRFYHVDEPTNGYGHGPIYSRKRGAGPLWFETPEGEYWAQFRLFVIALEEDEGEL